METVLETTRDIAEVTETTSSGGLSALGLLGPLVLSGLSSWVSARGASVLLDVERTTTAASAQSVRLVVSLTERGGTFRHSGCRLR